MGEVTNVVTEATHNEAVLVNDVGQNQMISSRYFKFTKKLSIVTSGGFGTMGFGLPGSHRCHLRSSRPNHLLFLRRRRFPDEHPGTGHPSWSSRLR